MRQEDDLVLKGSCCKIDWPTVECLLVRLDVKEPFVKVAASLGVSDTAGVEAAAFSARVRGGDVSKGGGFVVCFYAKGRFGLTSYGVPHHLTYLSMPQGLPFQGKLYAGVSSHSLADGRF